MNKNDIRAYLYVLGDSYSPSSATLPVIGCLGRVVEQLEKTNPRVAQLVMERERVNGIKPFGDPELVKKTVELISELRALIY